MFYRVRAPLIFIPFAATVYHDAVYEGACAIDGRGPLKLCGKAQLGNRALEGRDQHLDNII